MNVYGYVNNDPVNFTDAYGLRKIESDHLTKCEIDRSDENLMDEQFAVAGCCASMSKARPSTNV